MMESDRKRLLRNVVIFSLCTIGAGWLGAGLNHLLNLTDPNQNLGMLVFLVLPLMVSLLLRAFGGDGWQDIGFRPNFRGNAWAYALSLLAYPAMIAIILGAGVLAGATSFIRSDWGVFGQLVGISFVGNLFKNIFEEFSWRGYLTPKFKALGLSNMANHLLTGLIWGCWHIPYWLFLLDRATLASFTNLGLGWLIGLSLVAIFPTAILFGELRLKTGSTWPALLIHSVANALTLVLLVNGFISLKTSLEAIFTPGMGGLLGTVLVAGLGVWLYRRKTL
jgi:membrane protease YdiL (CAAX protease family)